MDKMFFVYCLNLTCFSRPTKNNNHFWFVTKFLKFFTTRLLQIIIYFYAFQYAHNGFQCIPIRRKLSELIFFFKCFVYVIRLWKVSEGVVAVAPAKNADDSLKKSSDSVIFDRLECFDHRWTHQGMLHLICELWNSFKYHSIEAKLYRWYTSKKTHWSGCLFNAIPTGQWAWAQSTVRMTLAEMQYVANRCVGVHDSFLSVWHE